MNEITGMFRKCDLDISEGIRYDTEEIGGREGIRTPDLLVANEALSQLSYSPTSSKLILAKARGLANTPSADRKYSGAEFLRMR